MKLLTKSNDRNATLGVLERSAYMMGSFGTVFVYTIVGAFLMYYYTDIVGLNGTIVGSILLFSRIFDGVSDLVMGLIVDRTHSKHGKTRAWVLWMCVPYAVSGVFLVAVPMNVPVVMQYVYVAITYNLVCTVTYTAMTVAYNALITNLTSNANEHAILSVFTILGGTIGGMVVQSTLVRATDALGGDARAWTIMTAVYATIGLIAHLLCFFGTKERSSQITAQKGTAPKHSIKMELSALFKNQYWIISVIVCFMAILINGILGAVGLYYVNSVFGDTSVYSTIANALSIGVVLGVFVSALLMNHIGKRNTMLIGAVLLTVSSAIMGLVGGNLTLVTVCMAIRGLVYGMISAGLYGMAADTIDYGEWKSGLKTDGIGLAGITFGTKIATGLSSVIIGVLTDISHYDSALAVQPASAVQTVNFCMNYIPAICGAIMVIALFLYKLDKIYPDIQRELGERHATVKSI